MTANDRLDTRLPIGFATHPVYLGTEAILGKLSHLDASVIAPVVDVLAPIVGGDHLGIKRREKVAAVSASARLNHGTAKIGPRPHGACARGDADGRLEMAIRFAAYILVRICHDVVKVVLPIGIPDL
jgi:hypothetical protein